MKQLRGLPIGEVPPGIEIDSERLAKLVQQYDEDGSNTEEESEEWFNSLTDDEQTIVEAWDERYFSWLGDMLTDSQGGDDK